MLTPERMMRVMIEFVFILLGALVVWLAARGRISMDRHSTTWLILSVVLMFWGLRVLYQPKLWWARWENWTRGLSFLLLGMLMLAITRVPFAWVGRMLLIGGGVLVLRGIVASALLFRPH